MNPKPESWVLYENEYLLSDKLNASVPTPSAEDRKLIIVWKNVVVFFLLHVGGVYGAYLFFTKAMWLTRLFALFLALCSSMGITAGAHRLWSHKAYKAKLPLRILLLIFNTLAFQYSVINWVRDHRMHHKYSETDADPHNATRGFFFSHIGWLMVKKHPQIKAKEKTIDLSDITSDPLLRFQKKYYIILVSLACYILPTYIPTYWDESTWTALFVCAFFRHIYVLNITWLVNSAAHQFGMKPYDKNIKPADLKKLSFVVFGEGFHNYHHTFPWDYKTSELGYSFYNMTKMLIDFMAKIGWAYDLKTVSNDIIEKRVKRTGDGSHSVWGTNKNDCLTNDIL